MPVIVVSSQDLAGLNIKKQLIDDFGFRDSGNIFSKNPVYVYDEIELLEIDEKLVYSDEVLKDYVTDYIIFASKHKSISGKPCLTVHIPGNLGKAELGGVDRQICRAPARKMKAAIKSISEQVHNLGISIEVCYEPIHHGPFLPQPCFFIEIGSSKSEWARPDLGKIIAAAIMDSIKSNLEEEVAIGLGGPFYNKRIAEKAIHSNISLVYSVSKYDLAILDKNLLKMILERTLPKVDRAILEWKSLGKEKSRILNLLETFNLKWEKLKI